MEKALEVLTDMHSIYKGDHRIAQALSEVKEAMKPKTCEGCKHDEELYCLTDMKKECYMCSRNVQDLYESKDNA